MKEIHISPGAQLVALLGLLALIVAGAAAQAPEIKRYLKMKEM